MFKFNFFNVFAFTFEKLYAKYAKYYEESTTD